MGFQSRCPTLQARHHVFRVVRLQGLLVALLALFWLFIWPASSLFVLYGGGALLAPTALFALYYCRAEKRPSARRVVVRFYVGGMARFFCSAVILAVLVAWKSPELLSLLVGFLGAQVGVWLAPLLT